MIEITKYTPVLDKFAVSTSTICAVHCLCLPLLLGFFPTLGSSFLGQEGFHIMLLWFVIPLSCVALTMGCRKHKSLSVALLGLGGLTLLIVTASLGHDILGEVGERVFTLMGALLIAVGHLRNYKLCRRAKCNSSDHPTLVV